MKKFKITLVLFLTFFLFININISLADDYLESDEKFNLVFDESDLEVSANITSVPVISSRAAVVIDRKTGLVLYEKNSDEIRKMASTTKIMTAIVVLENVSNLYENVTISKKAASVGGSVLGIRTNDKISINDLLYGLMLKSGNDTAIALAETVGGTVEGFAELMNKKAHDIGLENTHFVTPHGLDNEEHYTTAYELAKLADYALNNTKFKEIVNTKTYTVHINNNSMEIANSNELLGNFLGVYGVKTGFTNGANRCLVTACKRDGIDVISVVLGADTKNIRTKDSVKLLNYVYKNFEKVDIKNKIEQYFEEWERDNFIEIEKGIEKYLELKLSNIKYSQILVEQNKMDSIEIYIDNENILLAPVYKDTKVGELKLNFDGNEILKVDILAKNSIYKKAVYEYLVEIFVNFKKYMMESLI